MNLPFWFNSLWRLQSRQEYRRFQASTADVEGTQRRLLQSIVRANASSDYGREHGFGQVRSWEDYQRRAPVTSYDQLTPWIDRIAAGEPNVLTSEKVLMFEPTGGSSGGAKLIPYTASLRRQFQRAIAVWMHDLLTGLPSIRQGVAYWSISPGTDRPRCTAGGVPIGFESDTDYLAGWQRWVMSRLLAAPSSVARLRNMENFQYATLAYLLAAEHLSLVSVWSPTYLTTLLPRLDGWLERIADDLRCGELHLPQGMEEPHLPALPLAAKPERARQLLKLYNQHGLTPDFVAGCWPALALVSCWHDAAAGRFVPPLRHWFRLPLLQPKGLLATEGVVSFPLLGQVGGALAVRSHVLEFVDLQQPTSPPRGAWQLARGGRYRVLLTTGGGLYRYDLGDEVEVAGHLRQCPLVRFAGRSDPGCDLVGEKLHEQHLRACLERACQAIGITAGFALVAPQYSQPPRYHAFLGGWAIAESQASREDSIGQALSERLEQDLRENPQYRFAVTLGQLGPISVSLLDLSAEQCWTRYEQQCRRRGQRTGDIKPRLLVRDAGWLEAFTTKSD